MRSDIPKVLHTLAGRSMLSHALHSVAKVAPQHLVVVLGHDRDKIAPAVAELAGDLGRTDRGRGAGANSWAPATRPPAAWPHCPAGFDGVVVVTSGDIPLLDADTLADLIATHRAEAGRGRRC